MFENQQWDNLVKSNIHEQKNETQLAALQKQKRSKMTLVIFLLDNNCLYMYDTVPTEEATFESSKSAKNAKDKIFKDAMKYIAMVNSPFSKIDNYVTKHV